MGEPDKHYKDYKIYCCFALNRLVQALNIDLYQVNLEQKLDELLEHHPRVTKEDIKHEIRSNHYMTEKVLDRLQHEGHIVVEKIGKEYNIRITKTGILHIRKFNEFYRQMYKDQIQEHYRYKGTPTWLRDGS